jgi:L-threonylcarbamoyladenylate synthase
MMQKSLNDACIAIKKGDVIVYPTDTLYGLGADIFNSKAIDRIFTLKHRPHDLPLPVMVNCLEKVSEIAYLSRKAKKVMSQFLPGPLTVLLDKKRIVPDAVAPDKVAVRIPKNPLALRLAERLGPLTATSANIHGGQDPFTVDIARKQLGDYPAVYLDGGPLPGIPSTIIDIDKEKIIIVREGAIKKEGIYG